MNQYHVSIAIVISVVVTIIIAFVWRIVERCLDMLGSLGAGVRDGITGIYTALADVLGVVPSAVWGCIGAALLVILVLFTGAIALARALREIRTARTVDLTGAENILLYGRDGVSAISFTGATINSRVIEEPRRSGGLSPAETEILEKMRRRPQRLAGQSLKMLEGGKL